MKQKTKIEIAFDPGTSLTKVIYQINGEKTSTPKLWLAEPEVIALPKESIQKEVIGVANAVNNSWLTYRKNDTEAFAIGFFAKQFKAKVQLSQLKFEAAVPKFLGVIGAIIEKEGLDSSAIDIEAYILLPYGEFANRDILQEQIKKRAKTFYFRGQKIQTDIKKLLIAPEGMGFIQEAMVRRGREWLTRQDAISVLMIGHRNASLLTFTKGAVNKKISTTNDLGFVSLVNKVIERTSGHNREKLTQTIYELGNNISSDNKLLRAITHSENAKLITQEASQLAEAIRVARTEYWTLLKSWLGDVFPERSDALIISGGGAFYLQPELSEYLSWAKPTWRKAEGESAQEILAGESSASLKTRIADIWAMFQA